MRTFALAVAVLLLAATRSLAQENPSQGLGTAVPVTPAQPPVYVPPAGSGGAQPPGATSGTVIVAPPGQGGPPVAGPPRAGPPRPPPAGPSARFRLVASSFLVDHQTVDDMLERDGRGDEIFVRSDAYAYNRGRFMSRVTVRSGLFGQGREFPAGSARPGFNSADDQPGGLITGDAYPPRRDNFDGTPAARRGDLPMVLWEGTLWRDTAVMIVPSIWEWDSPEPSPAEAAWSRGLNSQAAVLQLGAIFVAGDPHAPRGTFPNGGVISTDMITPLLVFDDGTRPIGAQVHGADFRTGAGMRVNAIVLTYDSAVRAADQIIMFQARVQNPDGTVTSTEYPGPVGGFTLHFADPPQLEGEYTLFLRLVRLN